MSSKLDLGVKGPLARAIRGGQRVTLARLVGIGLITAQMHDGPWGTATSPGAALAGLVSQLRVDEGSTRCRQAIIYAGDRPWRVTGHPDGTLTVEQAKGGG